LDLIIPTRETTEANYKRWQVWKAAVIEQSNLTKVLEHVIRHGLGNITVEVAEMTNGQVPYFGY
jgi:hypothetical protein